MSGKNFSEELIALFDSLLQKGATLEKTSDAALQFYNDCGRMLIKVKRLNRAAQLSLEERRAEIDAKKSVVDRLQLDLENLRYKEAYLKREIRVCKDLPTPNLTAIENELGEALAMTVFSGSLHAANEKALKSLKDEQSARLATQDQLSKTQHQHENALARLDKKRKFLDELPAKLDVIKEATADLDTQFSTILTTNSC